MRIHRLATMATNMTILAYPLRVSCGYSGKSIGAIALRFIAPYVNAHSPGGGNSWIENNCMPASLTS